MGTFTRSGTFSDRARFIAAVTAKCAALREGPLRGFEQAWEEGPPSRIVLSGFGARLTFTIGAAEWTADAALPVLIPASMLESKFDREFSDLKGL